MIEKASFITIGKEFVETVVIIYSPDDETVKPRVRELLDLDYHLVEEKEYRNGSNSQYHATYQRRRNV